MLRQFTVRALRHGAVFQALCAIVLAIPQSTGADPQKEAAALVSLAIDQTAQRHFAEAAKLYDQAQMMLTKSLGSQHSETRALAQKREEFQRSLRLELLDRFVTITSLAEFRDRDFDQAIAEMRELVLMAPVQEQLFEQVKKILFGVGLKAESESVLRTALERFPKSRLLRINLAEVLSETGRTPDALAVLEEASRIPRPDGLDAGTDARQRAIILVRIGSMQWALSRPDDALKTYRQAVTVAPRWPEARISLGKAYLNEHRLEEAQTEFERSVKDAPDSGEAYLSLAELYVARGQWERGATAAGRAIELGAKDPRALYLLGTSLVRVGRREEGQSRLQEFSKVDASTKEVERRYTDIDAISLDAIRELREGSGDGAVQRFVQGIVSYPDSSRLLVNLAMVLSRMGEHQKAVEVLESMLRRTKESRFLIHKHLADEYILLGDREASESQRRIYRETVESEFLGSATR